MRTLIALALLLGTSAFAAEPQREWTFLVYLNGHNNLDGWSQEDMLEMEKVGSTDRVNVVVQWAYLPRRKVQRYLVTKSADPTKVTPPVLQDLGLVDMGDWRTLADFVRWGVENFPAKHYFIDVWAHGTGWHDKSSGFAFADKDISKDDLTGTAITTPQLAQVMAEAARLMGHRVDVYGSDACMMAMAEVATEMSNSVELFAGSELDVPLRGWPYDAFLSKWNALPEGAPARDVAKLLGDEFIASYRGEPGKKGATWSVWDVSKLEGLYPAVAQLGRELVALGKDDRKRAVEASIQTLDFSGDSFDLIDFVDQVEKQGVVGVRAETRDAVRRAVGELLVMNGATASWAKARGVAIWSPYLKRFYEKYLPQYRQLRFSKLTKWEDAVKSLTNQ